MLSPDDREQLLDALRPPQGYTLDRAIATTYSLDLLSLLTAPLAFTFFDSEDAEGAPSRDPVALLHAIRLHAEHLHVFCQEGRIAVPTRHQPLFQQLEGAIIQVRAPEPASGRRGVFHPKLWVMRFTTAEGPVRFRVLVSSRNLTFDRSWDVLLTLDGAASSDREIAANAPLAEFVAALPGMARRPVTPELRRIIDSLVRELRTVSFEKPPGCDRFVFHPLGHEGEAAWPFPESADRVLVIAPFVNAGCLARFRRMSDRVSLIGRADELAALPPSALKDIHPVWSWRPELEMSDEESDESPHEADSPPTGLHAKVVSVERGTDASLFVGSANATTAAFERNVEFVVELRGARRDFGVDALLGDQRGGLLPLLQPFEAGERETESDDAHRAEERLEELCDAISQLDLSIHVEAQEEQFDLVLRREGAAPPETGARAEVTCYPVSLPAEGNARPFALASPEPARFDRLSQSAITSFVAFVVKVRVGKATATRPFVLNLPIIGEPAGRAAALLQELLENREQVLALLLMMLSGEQFAADGLSDRLGRGNGFAEALGFGGDVTLFEALVRALDREPGRLDRLERTIRELRATADGGALLPEGFDEVWTPIWTARGERTT